MKRPMFERLFSYLLSAGLSGAILVLGLSLLFIQPQFDTADAEADEWPAPFELDEDALIARAAVVYDLIGNQILYAKNADESLPLASLTKLIAAHAVLMYEDPAREVVMSPTAIEPEGDWGFWVGEAWPLSDLISISLVASSNDAITAAAETLGTERISVINNEARKLGLQNMRILNPSGLDESLTTAGGYGSAQDMALLAGVFLKQHPTFFEATAAPFITIQHGGRMLTATSTATPLLSIPGLIGAKTGYTDLAGGNLVAAFDLELGRPLIVAVLGSTREGRFEDVKTLLEAARRKTP